MAVKKEWLCMAHGAFESVKGVCPKGCTTVERRFFTPTSIKTSDRTKNIDKTLEMLAKDYKMTDISNQHGTAAVKRPDSNKVNQMEQLNNAIREKYGVGMGGGWGQLPEQGAGQAAQNLGATPTVNMTDVKQTLPDWRQNIVVHAKDDSKVQV